MSRHPPTEAGHDRRCRIGAGRPAICKLESGESDSRFRVVLCHARPAHAEANATRYLDHGLAQRQSSPSGFSDRPGKALDPDAFSSCASIPSATGSPAHPATALSQPGMRFPRFCLRDMVQSQYRLLTEKLGVSNSAYGAWRVHGRHAGAAVGRELSEIHALAGRDDADGAHRALGGRGGGNCAPRADGRSRLERRRVHRYPERGWRAWSRCHERARRPHASGVGEMFDAPLETLQWMEKVTADNRANGFDATDWLYQSWAYQAHDVGTTPDFNGNTSGALETIQARAMILAPPLDLLNPTYCAQEAADSIPGATMIEIPSDQGHQAAANVLRRGCAIFERGSQ